jgi:hypothetical protein
MVVVRPLVCDWLLSAWYSEDFSWNSDEIAILQTPRNWELTAKGGFAGIGCSEIDYKSILLHKKDCTVVHVHIIFQRHVQQFEAKWYTSTNAESYISIYLDSHCDKNLYMPSTP